MNTELIIQILTLLLGGGGVIALFFITERKTKAQIENINLAIDEWQKIVERCRAELKEARTSAKEFQDLYMAPILILGQSSVSTQYQIYIANAHEILSEAFSEVPSGIEPL